MDLTSKINLLLHHSFVHASSNMKTEVPHVEICGLSGAVTPPFPAATAPLVLPWQFQVLLPLTYSFCMICSGLLIYSACNFQKIAPKLLS